MRAIPHIPGVTLEVYKQDRQLAPETDGYVGQLWSGSVVILAIIDPGADHTIGIFRDGSDHYTQQRDWLNEPRTQAQLKCHATYLADRKFADRTKVYGVKIPLHVNGDMGINAVCYPENMLMLAQYCCSGKHPAPGDFALIWKVAIVSQDDKFFLTAQEAYDVCACKNGDGVIGFPRLRGHHQLERIIVENMPKQMRCYDGSDPLPDPAPTKTLKANEGIVERWYDARNMGCVVTSQGTARVHWREAPARPRRRFLVAGERVQFTDLGLPPKNPGTKWRQPRKARFKLQASGLQVLG